MKSLQPVLALTLFSLALPSLAADEADRDLKDFIAYFRSVRTPTVVDLCKPITDDKSAFAQLPNNWLQANSEPIARGKNIALSRMQSEQQLDDSNAAMLADLKDDFARKSLQDKVTFCGNALNSYKLTTSNN
ncbi:MAG TPA: hypothetical protein VFW93_03780 [Aquabacterium sp.]|uniref:hypothetical protein n=1 Tax=Aquabacterium sp. TaxID=1872578 RepID=UPI002E36B577|nr:hypothetical protein [Aquabacterium sp.]HEX5355312.1 hypothetical protein [Aquabacterium sp.]